MGKQKITGDMLNTKNKHVYLLSPRESANVCLMKGSLRDGG